MSERYIYKIDWLGNDDEWIEDTEADDDLNLDDVAKLLNDQQANIERLRAERDEARYAARWLYQWVEESEWTHFCKEDGDMLKQWTWLLEATNG